MGKPNHGCSLDNDFLGGFTGERRVTVIMHRLNLVSIIIPNLHSPIVGQTLQSLEAQDYAGPFEIIVVGQDKYGQVSEGGRVRAIVTPQSISPAAARNLGILSAQGEILVFIDSDCVASRDWLRRRGGH